MQKYLQEEEKQKILFKEDLLAYKKDCNKIKAENDYLKMEMQRRGLLLDVDAKSQRTLSNTLPQGGIQNRSRRESIPAFKFNEY